MYCNPGFPLKSIIYTFGSDHDSTFHVTGTPALITLPCNFGQKYYAPQVWPDQASILWPPDHGSTFWYACSNHCMGRQCHRKCPYGVRQRVDCSAYRNHLNNIRSQTKWCAEIDRPFQKDSCLNHQNKMLLFTSVLIATIWLDIRKKILEKQMYKWLQIINHENWQCNIVTQFPDNSNIWRQRYSVCIVFHGT